MNLYESREDLIAAFLLDGYVVTVSHNAITPNAVRLELNRQTDDSRIVTCDIWHTGNWRLQSKQDAVTMQLGDEIQRKILDFTAGTWPPKPAAIEQRQPAMVTHERCDGDCDCYEDGVDCFSRAVSAQVYRVTLEQTLGRLEIAARSTDEEMPAVAHRELAADIINEIRVVLKLALT